MLTCTDYDKPQSAAEADDISFPCIYNQIIQKIDLMMAWQESGDHFIYHSLYLGTWEFVSDFMAIHQTVIETFHPKPQSEPQGDAGG